jgi:hypothetical protein
MGTYKSPHVIITSPAKIEAPTEHSLMIPTWEYMLMDLLILIKMELR